MNMESLPPALPQSNVLVTMGMRARVRGLTSDIGKTLNGLIVTVMEEAVYTSHNKTRTQVHRTGTGNDRQRGSPTPPSASDDGEHLTPLKHPKKKIKKIIKTSNTVVYMHYFDHTINNLE